MPVATRYESVTAADGAPFDAWARTLDFFSRHLRA